MGWGRMLLLGNWGQQMDIEDQRQELESLRRQLASRHSGSSPDRLAALERENAQMRLYLAALVRYLVSRGTVNVDEFRVLVDQIDREDGQEDGGFNGKVV